MQVRIRYKSMLLLLVNAFKSDCVIDARRNQKDEHHVALQGSLGSCTQPLLDCVNNSFLKCYITPKPENRQGWWGVDGIVVKLELSSISNALVTNQSGLTFCTSVEGVRDGNLVLTRSAICEKLLECKFRHTGRKELTSEYVAHAEHRINLFPAASGVIKAFTCAFATSLTSTRPGQSSLGRDASVAVFQKSCWLKLRESGPLGRGRILGPPVHVGWIIARENCGEWVFWKSWIVFLINEAINTSATKFYIPTLLVRRRFCWHST